MRRCNLPADWQATAHIGKKCVSDPRCSRCEVFGHFDPFEEEPPTVDQEFTKADGTKFKQPVQLVPVSRRKLRMKAPTSTSWHEWYSFSIEDGVVFCTICMMEGKLHQVKSYSSGNMKQHLTNAHDTVKEPELIAAQLAYALRVYRDMVKVQPSIGEAFGQKELRAAVLDYFIIEGEALSKVEKAHFQRMLPRFGITTDDTMRRLVLERSGDLYEDALKLFKFMVDMAL